MPLMPRCNAYGLQGTEFLDLPPVPRATVRGKSWMTAEPPYGDFSPGEPGVFDAEDKEEENPMERGRTPPSASPQGKGKMPAGHEDTGVEPPLGRPAPLSPLTGQKSGGESKTFRPRWLPKTKPTRACRCRTPSKTLWGSGGASPAQSGPEGNFSAHLDLSLLARSRDGPDHRGCAAGPPGPRVPGSASASKMTSKQGKLWKAPRQPQRSFHLPAESLRGQNPQEQEA